MVRLVRSPKFSPKKELARYVSEDDRLNGDRTALTAFIDPPCDDPSKDYLSVNSLEVEGAKQIADYYRNAFQGGTGDVSLCTTKVGRYTDAGKKSDVQLVYDERAESWQFIGKSLRPEPAYTHRPVLTRPDGLKSPSHCGVEFVRVMDEHRRSKFARRLSGRKFHTFKIDTSSSLGRKAPGGR